MEDRRELRIRRGREARELLNSDIARESFEDIETKLIEDWAATEAADVQGRERFYLRFLAVRAFRQALKNIQDDGRIAETSLSRSL